MAIPDRQQRLLQKLIEQAQPSSLEELQHLLNSLIGSPLPEIPEDDLTPQDRAFDLVDEAWKSSAAKGASLAWQALELWPDCIPAYEYLSAVSKSKQQRIANIEKAVEIGQRLYGGEFRKKHTGHYWQITETRPYMRCLDALAQLNAEAGNLSKAIVIWEDIILLNSSDNMGVRQKLLPAFLRQADLKSYRQYRKNYPEDTAPMQFNDALADFMEKGATTSAGKQLQRASKSSPFIVPLLLHQAPPAELPDTYAFFSPEEAIIYAAETWTLWREIPGALLWLKTFQSEQKNHVTGLAITELSQAQQSMLLRDPYSPISPLRLRTDLKDEHVAHVPFIPFCRAFLSEIQKAQALKLTTKGNLPRALVHSMYNLRLFPSQYIDDGTLNLRGEDNFPELMIAHALCGIAKWIKKTNGKVSLTKKGIQALQSADAQLYQELLKIYTQQYNWAYTEHWSFGAPHTGQTGWAMILYELLRQGDTRQPDRYYANLYFQLLPQLLQQYRPSQYFSPLDKATSDLRNRFFDRFGRLFGLVETEKNTEQPTDFTELVVRRTELAARVFELG